MDSNAYSKENILRYFACPQPQLSSVYISLINMCKEFYFLESEKSYYILPSSYYIRTYWFLNPVFKTPYQSCGSMCTINEYVIKSVTIITLFEYITWNYLIIINLYVDGFISSNEVNLYKHDYSIQLIQDKMLYYITLNKVLYMQVRNFLQYDGWRNFYIGWIIWFNK